VPKYITGIWGYSSTVVCHSGKSQRDHYADHSVTIHIMGFALISLYKAELSLKGEICLNWNASYSWGVAAHHLSFQGLIFRSMKLKTSLVYCYRRTLCHLLDWIAKSTLGLLRETRTVLHANIASHSHIISSYIAGLECRCTHWTQTRKYLHRCTVNCLTKSKRKCIKTTNIWVYVQEEVFVFFQRMKR